MKKPKSPEQVYREYLAKDTGYRKVDNLPACCGTCYHYDKDRGDGTCNVGEEYDRDVEPDHVCNLYHRFDAPFKEVAQ